MGASKASVLYVYIDDNNNNNKKQNWEKLKLEF